MDVKDFLGTVPHNLLAAIRANAKLHKKSKLARVQIDREIRGRQQELNNAVSNVAP